MVMLNRRSFLLLGASIPIAAATTALVATPAPAAAEPFIGVDYGLTCRDWTCIQWWCPSQDAHGQIWVRPLPRFVRGFVRGDRVGIEVSKTADGPWFELVSTDADNRQYIGSPLYLAAFEGSRIPELEAECFASYTPRDRWRFTISGSAESQGLARFGPR